MIFLADETCLCFRAGRQDRMSGNIQQQRAAVEQARREANIKRISVSQAVEDIKVRVEHILLFPRRRFILLQANPKISIH